MLHKKCASLRSARRRVADIQTKWEKNKPLQSNVRCAEALTLLADYEVKINKAVAEFESLSSARDALGLEPSPPNPLLSIKEELKELEEVWRHIEPISNALDETKDTLWNTIVIKKGECAKRASLHEDEHTRRWIPRNGCIIKAISATKLTLFHSIYFAPSSLGAAEKQVNDIIASLRSLPNSVRQYDTYRHLHNTVKKYSDSFPFLSDLKNESLKLRHWKKITSRLALQISMNELTLGNLWDANLLDKKKELSEILTTATGEMALEQFIVQVQSYWSSANLELVLYQNRVRLIKGWDDLLGKIDEHLNSLSLMKLSPYFKSVPEFQEGCKSWEERLTKLRSIFNSWVDIQRRWVYLESIFFGSADIKTQLPSEYSKFKSVDNDFVQLMRKVAAKPQALGVLGIENLQTQLDRNESLMCKIQKCLGEYLEKQRECFR